ncbi:PilZ domain-containing protein [Beggiatoa alba]|nr:PilZ domain-containing protein [Beggiatoa alba]
MIHHALEKRQFPRKRVISSIRVSHQLFGEMDGQSRDISDCGMYVVIENLPTLPKGSHLNMQLLDSCNPCICFNTRVVRMSNEGVGLAIVDYEVDGERFPLKELRRQWTTKKSSMRLQ